MKTRYGLILPLALGLAANGAALAACDATLVSVGASTVVVKANCGAVALTGIEWFRNGVSLTGGDIAVVVNNTDVYYSTPAVSGTSKYTAAANAGAQAAGTPATVILPNPLLTVAPTVGGTVSSAPAGITGCTSVGGTCSATFSSGASVVLTAAPTGGYAFTGWGGDCSGASTCTVFMTTARTATATFTAGTPPSAPTIGTATPGNTQVSVAFTPGAIGTGTLVNYQATCSVGGSGGGTPVSGGSSPIIVTGLTNGTTYLCNAQTISTIGASAWSADSASATPSPGTPPSAPTIGTATPGNTQISVAFTPGAIGTGTLVNYQATCSVGGSGGGTPVSGGSSPIIVTGLTNGTAYLCNARAVSTVGNGAWSGDSASTTPSPGTPPSAPTIGTASAGNTQISVAFTPGAIGTGTLVNYEATCSVAGGGAGTPVAGGSSPIVVTGLTNGTAYLCNARTISTVGTSPWSANSGSTTPFASSCGPGEVFDTVAGDRVWTPFSSYTLWPVPAATGTGDLGRALQFVADSGTYPNGVKITLTDESIAALAKDYVVSACPHNFSPVGGSVKCMKEGIGSSGTLYLRFGPLINSYDCPLTPGGTYYINFRQWSTPRSGTVSTQMSFEPR